MLTCRGFTSFLKLSIDAGILSIKLANDTLPLFLQIVPFVIVSSYRASSCQVRFAYFGTPSMHSSGHNIRATRVTETPRFYLSIVIQ